ncbi:DUF2306 domain-containing protein [Loktanella agnita]|uniref:DUF2306 domain-containing protein n=1 Tax=Loktanella agnita TaxID=287097 RepID=UPI003989E86D
MMSLTFARLRFALFALLCLLIAAMSARLLIPELARTAGHLHYHYEARFLALYGHIAFAVIALAVMPFQFSTRLRAARPGLHRLIGRIYVASCIIGGLCGLWLAVGTQAGLVAAWGFGLLAVVWIWCTLQGLFAARARAFADHRRWMIRSAALTFGAVTLRIYLIGALAAGLDFNSFYPLLGWISWVPNLIIAEWVLLERRPARVRA